MKNNNRYVKKLKIELPDDSTFVKIDKVNLSESKRILYLDIELDRGYPTGTFLVSLAFNKESQKFDIRCPFILKRRMGHYSFFAGITWDDKLFVNELPDDSPQEAVWTYHPERCRIASKKEIKALLKRLKSERGLTWDEKTQQLIPWEK